MGILQPPDKRKILTDLGTLLSRFGPAPLTNVNLGEIDENDVDVVAVGSVVVRRDGSTVLIRREETPDEWLIPGGTVDPGESLLETAQREVKEETGLTTEVEALLRVGLMRDYGPAPFRAVNKKRFGKESINLLFVNFRAKEIEGDLDCSLDPSQNMLEVRAFKNVPFDSITHVYKVLFVYERYYHANLADYPAVEFEPVSS
jgi:8-oxo-dGTP pyrophosphatase MutT (NUDIX family)